MEFKVCKKCSKIDPAILEEAKGKGIKVKYGCVGHCQGDGLAIKINGKKKLLKNQDELSELLHQTAARPKAKRKSPKWLAFLMIATVLVSLIYAYLPRESRAQKLSRPFTAQEEKIKKDVIFTKEELSKYDGSNGVSYVAINGVVYDASEKWKGGKHKSLTAGVDITEKFANTGHGSRLLKKLKVVGSYRP